MAFGPGTLIPNPCDRSACATSKSLTFEAHVRAGSFRGAKFSTAILATEQRALVLELREAEYSYRRESASPRHYHRSDTSLAV